MPMPEVQELPPTPPTPSGISGEGVEYLLNEFQVDPSWQSTDPADEDYIEGVKAAYRDVVELIQQARLDYPA